VRIFTPMALIALVIATTASVAATGRLTLPLLLSGIACWSFVPVLHLLTGLLLLRGSVVERVPAIERYFATHRYWSLWLLTASATVLLLPDPGGALAHVLATALVPAILTARALTRFATEVLGHTPSRARRRVGLHQAITLLLLVIYVDLSVALWPRIVGTLAR